MRPSKLKLDEKQKRLVFLIDFLFNVQNILLQDWKFANKIFFCYVKNPFSYYISFQIGMYKQMIIKNVLLWKSKD